MAKFCGNVGYAETVERSPGVFVEEYTERRYFGDVIRHGRNLSNNEYVNDDITINNQISIVADAYANDHIFAMRYIEWMGTCWKVVSVDVQRPRLVLTLGGEYLGQKA